MELETRWIWLNGFGIEAGGDASSYGSPDPLGRILHQGLRPEGESRWDEENPRGTDSERDGGKKETSDLQQGQNKEWIWVIGSRSMWSAKL